MAKHFSSAEQSQLGKITTYDFNSRDPNQLFPIARAKNRAALGIYSEVLPFHGFDYWNHYEVSWLNLKGKPIVALAEIIYDCRTLNIIESKSLKLYFNSLNQTKFKDVASVTETVYQDLQERLGNNVTLIVKITPLSLLNQALLVPRFDGLSLDELDIDCSVYQPEPAFLTTENDEVSETLCSDLLKSHCLVTNQPDWCSLKIIYEGKRINHAGLLRYIVSFRHTNEFHEQCIEKIFLTLMARCQPKHLTVYGRSTRRGGLDINAYRSTQAIVPEAIPNIRLYRQ